MSENPVVVTGASGFLAGHVIRAALGAGHHVRGSLRNPARADEVRAAVLPGLPPDAADRLSFVTLDLGRDDGWAAALAGARALVHTASPFPIAQPRNPDDLIRPAVDGTRRALTAAARAGVGRVVLTSSVAAIQTPFDRPVQDEGDWADLGHPAATPYVQSKTLAERAAWEIAAAQGLRLTAINPSLILGPVLGRTFGSSVGLVRRMLTGKDPLQPPISLAVVDVRDVARMHVAALDLPATEGQRIIASAGTLWFREMAAILKTAHPQRRIAMREAPRWVIRLLALTDPQVRAITGQLGYHALLANDRALALFGQPFIPAEEALRASATDLIRLGLA
jgi:dihydroflavonol-4-reductase